MIKKAIFEDELIVGMQRELRPHEEKQAMGNLVQAVEYLQAAAEILEEGGLTAKADQVLRILGKIVLAESEAKEKDKSPADKDQDNDDFYKKVMKWIENPHTPVNPDDPQPGEEISFKSLLNDPMNKEVKVGDELSFTSLKEPITPSDDDLVFKSLAQELGLLDDNDARVKPRKPKNPLSIHDPHTHRLTPEKMVANLKHHGTEFNMVDDGAADDLEEIIKDVTDKGGSFNMAFNLPDQQDAVDLLNIDIGNGDLEIEEEDSSTDKTFEDSD